MNPAGLATFFLILSLNCNAQSISSPPYPIQDKGSIQSALTLEGINFTVVHWLEKTNVLVDAFLPINLFKNSPTPNDIQPPIHPTLYHPLGFMAKFSLKNNKNIPLKFTFPWVYWATKKIVFSVYDTNDAMVWTSAPIPIDCRPIAQPVELTLSPGKSWSQSVFVPFNYNGTDLLNGTYRLEATVSGTPLISANSSFTINHVFGCIYPPLLPPILNPIIITDPVPNLPLSGQP